MLGKANFTLSRTAFPHPFVLFVSSVVNFLHYCSLLMARYQHPAFQAMRDLLSLSFNHHASVQHYVNMAYNNKRQWLDRDMIKIKKYLYTIRPLLCAQWVLQHHSQPPMLYHELLSSLHPGTEIEAEVQSLVRRKQDLNELDLVPRSDFLTEWIEQGLSTIVAALPKKAALPPWENYNAVFRQLLKQTTP